MRGMDSLGGMSKKSFIEMLYLRDKQEKRRDCVCCMYNFWRAGSGSRCHYLLSDEKCVLCWEVRQGELG